MTVITTSFNIDDASGRALKEAVIAAVNENTRSRRQIAADLRISVGKVSGIVHRNRHLIAIPVDGTKQMRGGRKSPPPPPPASSCALPEQPRDIIKGRCRYITGDPRHDEDWHYCQERTEGHGAWCAHHESIVYPGGIPYRQTATVKAWR